MSYVLVCNPNTDTETSYHLQNGKNTIGRSLSNRIAIQHNSISRYHAEIIINHKRIKIRDLNSLNGTFVNQLQVSERELKNGDWIIFGTVQFQFQDSGETLKPESDTDGITIIHQVSPKESRVDFKDILGPNLSDNSALNIKHQDLHQRSLDRLRILLEVSKQLSSPSEPEKLLEKILDLLLEIMKVDRAAILLLEEGTQNLQCKAVRSRTGASVNYQFYSTRIINYVCKEGQAILTGDAGVDNRFEGSKSIVNQTIRASICAPLQPREEVIGVLYVDNLSHSNAYGEEDLEFLTALANQAAIAIDNTRLTKKMQEEAVWRDKLERFFPSAVSRKLREEGNLEIIDTEVTALFADISDFTKMSSTMEPRQIIEMLNEYFSVMAEEIVFAYEGTLEKYIGDALLAIWGAPYSRPDDSDRAIQAAIEMQWAVRRLNSQWEQKNRQPIAIHIGLNTGKVAAGNIGSKKLIQYATIGDTTNVASRICNLANPNEILISQSTFDRLKNQDISLTKMPLMTVKGKAEPLQLYRLHWQHFQTEYYTTA